MTDSGRAQVDAPVHPAPHGFALVPTLQPHMHHAISPAKSQHANHWATTKSLNPKNLHAGWLRA